jgi:hypothetical protein
VAPPSSVAGAGTKEGRVVGVKEGRVGGVELGAGVFADLAWEEDLSAQSTHKRSLIYVHICLYIRVYI